jgi:hypothetical protein
MSMRSLALAAGRDHDHRRRVLAPLRISRSSSAPSASGSARSSSTASKRCDSRVVSSALPACSQSTPRGRPAPARRAARCRRARRPRRSAGASQAPTAASADRDPAFDPADAVDPAPRGCHQAVPNLVSKRMPTFCSSGVGSRPPAQTMTASLARLRGPSGQAQPTLSASMARPPSPAAPPGGRPAAAPAGAGGSSASRARRRRCGTTGSPSCPALRPGRSRLPARCRHHPPPAPPGRGTARRRSAGTPPWRSLRPARPACVATRAGPWPAARCACGAGRLLVVHDEAVAFAFDALQALRKWIFRPVFFDHTVPELQQLSFWISPNFTVPTRASLTGAVIAILLRG